MGNYLLGYFPHVLSTPKLFLFIKMVIRLTFQITGPSHFYHHFQKFLRRLSIIDYTNILKAIPYSHPNNMDSELTHQQK
jgi:hypothetical protein